jgi:DNA-binding transcriptional LysR family regulator
MRLDYFKTFLTVAKTRSFSVAAKELKTSQGTVSNHIAALEAFFDVELFTRGSSGAEVTEAGALLVQTAEDILDLVEQVKVNISLLKKKLSGIIRIEASTIPGEHIIPSLVAEFQNRYPGVRFKIRAEDSLNSLLNLQSGDVDFAAVGTLTCFNEKLEVLEVGKEELVLIVPNSHELANQRSATLKEILKYTYINREETSGTRKEIGRIFQEAGLSASKLKTTLELGSTESVITAVSEGRGVSIISSIASKKAQAAGLVKVLHIEGVDATRKLYMVRSSRPLVKASEAFWDFCKKYIAGKNASQ